MLIRIVHMHFKAEEVPAFLALFEKQKEFISGFEGCMYVELLQSKEDASAFTTYSHWVDEEALEQYRASTFFRTVWSNVKPLFDERPVAYSYTLKSKSGG